MRRNKQALLVNFTYYDSATYIGSLKGVEKKKTGRFFRYECKPGRHIFWANAPLNKSYIIAELDAGKNYFIESKPGIETVKLKPLNKNKIQTILIANTLSRNDPKEIDLDAEKESIENIETIVQEGLAKFRELERKNKKFKKLEPTMNFENEDYLKILNKKE